LSDVVAVMGGGWTAKLRGAVMMAKRKARKSILETLLT
jgi:hypothetical protein